MHLTQLTLSTTQKYARQEYKEDLRLVRLANLMNVKWKLHSLDTVSPHFDKGEIITIAEDKKGPSPLLQLQLLKVATTTVVQSHYCNWMN